MLVSCSGNNYNFSPQRVSFCANPLRLNLKSVSEALCSDYFQKQVSPFDNPLLYKYLSKDAVRTDKLLSKLYKRKLPKYDEILEQSNIDKKHRVLLVDPEVTSRLEELSEYVTKEKIDTTKLTPFELRKGFSDYLGTETVYRGLNSDEGETLIQTLKQEGIYPQYHKDKEEVLNSIKYYLTTTARPVWNIFSKFRDVIGGKHTEFMSVSSMYDVAASVPKGNNSAKTPVVVIKSQVPKLSVIKQRGDFAQRFPIDDEVLVIGDKKYDYATKREQIEAFIPFHIPTKDSVYSVDRTTPDYKWG